jgi:predicted Holliday junction resolvase-like endonuclease
MARNGMGGAEIRRMEMLYRLASPDILYTVLGALAGGGSVWLVSYLLFRLRLRRAVSEAGERALSSSRRVLKGQAAEQLAPLTGGFDYLPNDSRFLGSPIDYVVFDGLSEDSAEVEIVFVEVKTGRSRLTPREARVKEAVQAGRVRWHELRM